ncbi:hypothetical protein HaLaN_12438, partial [Haematococcus lacustris]
RRLFPLGCRGVALPNPITLCCSTRGNAREGPAKAATRPRMSVQDFMKYCNFHNPWRHNLSTQPGSRNLRLKQ